jgi:L-alanine-DL-glutamate epimerase-like enolase superfamily enzyme
LKLDVQRRTLAFKRPVQTSYGVLAEREVLAVSLTGEDGIAGYGEAAPLQPYDGVSIERVERALASYAPVLADSTDLNGAQMIDACRRVGRHGDVGPRRAHARAADRGAAHRRPRAVRPRQRDDLRAGPRERRRAGRGGDARGL